MCSIQANHEMAIYAFHPPCYARRSNFVYNTVHFIAAQRRPWTWWKKAKTIAARMYTTRKKNKHYLLYGAHWGQQASSLATDTAEKNVLLHTATQTAARSGATTDETKMGGEKENWIVKRLNELRAEFLGISHSDYVRNCKKTTSTDDEANHLEQESCIGDIPTFANTRHKGGSESLTVPNLLELLNGSVAPENNPWRTTVTWHIVSFHFDFILRRPRSK